jgi:hypothetical protein
MFSLLEISPRIIDIMVASRGQRGHIAALLDFLRVAAQRLPVAGRGRDCVCGGAP